MRLKLAAVAAVLLMVAASSAGAQTPRDNSSFDATTLHLSATGEAHAAPDMAVINLGVQTEAPTAADALRQNRTQMTATIEALKAKGVLAKDIQTSSLNLSPQYTFHDNERHLNGYQASNAVTITVRDLAHLGSTLDAVVAAGANQVNGIGFNLSDPKQAEDDARRAAVKALTAKAELYAEATGYHIARLVSLTDSSNQAGVIRPTMMEARYQDVATRTPTEPGQLDIVANVSAVYELRK